MEKTPITLHGHVVRMNNGERQVLAGMGLCYAVVIAKDVSVRVTGAVESVHRSSGDALKDALRLSEMYHELDSFVVVDLGHATAIPLPKEGTHV
jgi:hypothetical protein